MTVHRRVTALVALVLGFVGGLLVGALLPREANAPEPAPGASPARQPAQRERAHRRQAVSEAIEIRIGADEELDVGALMQSLLGVRLAAMSLQFVFEDSSDQLPAGCSVELRALDDGYEETVFRAVTETDGHVEFADVPYPLSYNVSIRSDSHGVDHSRRVWVARPAFDDVLRVPQSLIIQGNVVSAAGEPVPNAFVFASVRVGEGKDVYERLTGTSDGAGRFRFVERGMHGDVDVVGAVAPGFAPGRGVLATSGATFWEGRVTLPAGGRVTGRVVDWDGRPVANAVVGVTSLRSVPAVTSEDEHRFLQLAGAVAARWGQKGSQEHMEMIKTWTRSQTDGSFNCVQVIPSARTMVVVEKDGAPPVFMELGAAPAPPGHLDAGTISLGLGGAPIRVRFLSEAQEPLASARVSFQSMEVPQSLQLNSPTYIVDGDGFVESSFLERGKSYRAFFSGAVSAVSEIDVSSSQGPGDTFIVKADRR